MLSFIAASVTSSYVMDKLGRISKQLDNLESAFGLERGGFGAGECADAVKMYCEYQGSPRMVGTRKQKINFVTGFCESAFCDIDDNGVEEDCTSNKRGPASKCVLFQAEFCAYFAGTRARFSRTAVPRSSR